MDAKQNRCQFCQTLFTPAFRHPNQTCCGKKKCVLAKRAMYQRKKMKEDPEYRQNQKDSNQTWREKTPDYWKNYRKRNPQKTEENRLRQQIRNQKRKGEHSVAETDGKIAKMNVVDQTPEMQEKDLWLVSSSGRIPPIKLILLVQNNRPEQTKSQASSP